MEGRVMILRRRASYIRRPCVSGCLSPRLMKRAESSGVEVEASQLGHEMLRNKTNRRTSDYWLRKISFGKWAWDVDSPFPLQKNQWPVEWVVREKGNAECNERIHIVGALSAGSPNCWCSEGEEDFRRRRLSTSVPSFSSVGVQQLRLAAEFTETVDLKAWFWMGLREAHISPSWI